MEINNIKDQIEKTISLNFDKKIPTFMMYVSAYFTNSAGIMAQYKLANDLQAKGYNVFGILWDEWNQLNVNFVNTVSFKIYHDICIIPKDFAIEMCQKYNCIAIYTDHDNGNLLNAKVVSRWLGYRPGKLGSSEFHDLNENIFCYCKYFSNYQDNPKSKGELTIYPTIDSLHQFFWYDPNIQKQCISVYTGKKKYIESFVPKYDIMITRKYPSTKEVLGDILRKTKILYTFDSCTALIYEAMLCGCKVIVIDAEGIYTREDLFTSECGTTGMYMHGDNIDDSLTPETISNTVVENIKKINDNYQNSQLLFFIDTLMNDFTAKCTNVK